MAKKRKVRSTPAAQPTPTQPPIETEQQPQPESIEPQQPQPESIEPQQPDPQVEEEEEIEEEEEEEDNSETEENQEEEGTNGSDAKPEDDEDEQESVEKLIEPFSKEQLAVLVKEAVEKFPEFIQQVERLADADPAHRKIFVHGLGWDTNAETLIAEFSKYGQVEDCKAVTDKVSGKSKGYGFILFKHRAGAQKALKEPQKKIGNRVTSCQLASAGPVAAPPPPPVAAPVSEYTQRKIFVSNVSADIEPGKLVEFFAKFGEIEDGPLGLDKQTGKPKGFALFVYKSVESAKKALEEPHKTFEGHTLHCQRAIDGPKPGKGGFQQHQHQPQQHHHQGYHHVAKKSRYSTGGGGGHLMAPSGPSVGYNPVAPAGALTPALGQALTALLATQGAGLGNLLGGLGGQVNQGMPGMNNAGYGNQGGGYGAQLGMQGGYQNQQMGPGSSRPQQGGGSYMGHGH